MDAATKQQIVERIKQAENILVTVSKNPSVDQLAALIGLTLLLNKMSKSATAVFSGKVPSTIEFLQPAKTIETNTDSLRDFIISLDKSKADKLRYKVEDQVVRIFITPYRSSISQKDLVFTQGDFNVEVVMALGITDRSQIDETVSTHGRILHDATVISINPGQAKAGDVGQINWQDPTASSLSEMLISISEAFGAGLIDNQIATAFLTGIVAETSRFSNSKTSPKVMTMSAQMMAAGANQQLIVSKLEPPPPPPPKPQAPRPQPPPAPVPKKEPPKPPKKPLNTLKVSHQPAKTDGPEVEIGPNEIRIDTQGNLKTAAELKAEKDARVRPPMPEPVVIPEPPSVPEPAVIPKPPPMPESLSSPPLPPTPPKNDPPSLNPHSLLDPHGGQPTSSSPFTADTAPPSWEDSYNTVPIDPLGESPQKENSLSERERTIAPPVVDNARSAVASALAASPVESPLPPIQSINAAPLGPELYPPAPAAVPPPSPPVAPPPFPPPPPGLATPPLNVNHNFPLPPNPA
jgi:hypothetical protein